MPLCLRGIFLRGARKHVDYGRDRSRTKFFTCNHMGKYENPNREFIVFLRTYFYDLLIVGVVCQRWPRISRWSEMGYRLGKSFLSWVSLLRTKQPVSVFSRNWTLFSGTRDPPGCSRCSDTFAICHLKIAWCQNSSNCTTRSGCNFGPANWTWLALKPPDAFRLASKQMHKGEVKDFLQTNTNGL